MACRKNRNQRLQRNKGIAFEALKIPPTPVPRIHRLTPPGRPVVDPRLVRNTPPLVRRRRPSLLVPSLALRSRSRSRRSPASPGGKHVAALATADALARRRTLLGHPQAELGLVLSTRYLGRRPVLSLLVPYLDRNTLSRWVRYPSSPERRPHNKHNIARLPGYPGQNVVLHACPLLSDLGLNP